jgi:uncharacterized damage-inducible protein DinB
MNRLLAVALIALSPLASARTSMRSPQTTPSAAPKSGFRAEFLRDLDEMQQKIVALANAVPAEKYNWRPGAGVRSVSEVYMHIAGGNYYLASFVGARPPAYDSNNFEKITDKQRVIDELKKSFDFIRAAAMNASDADLDKTVKMPGSDTTMRGAFMMALNHLHEHLGQSIAYARMNGVVPPWSARD